MARRKTTPEAAPAPAPYPEQMEAISRVVRRPDAFRERIKLTPSGPSFADQLAPFQRRDFSFLDQAFVALANGTMPKPNRLWIERTKGASKDTDVATSCIWLLAFLPAYRLLTCQVAAADQQQADELRKAARQILRANPWLDELVEVEATRIVGKASGSTCDILTADVGGSHGARPDLLIINEVTHVAEGKEEFVLNLLDNASKVPKGVVLVLTNAGHTDHFAWRLREDARTSGEWYFSQHCEPAPWLDPAELRRAERRNTRSRFLRLWRGIWSKGSGDALDERDISACVNKHLRPMAGSERGYHFFGGLDLATRRDHAALAGIGLHVGFYEEAPPKKRNLPPHVEAMLDLGMIEDGPVGGGKDEEQEGKHHPGTGRIRLAHVESWAPPGNGGEIDLMGVENAVLDAHRRFRFMGVFFDPFQASLMAQRLRAKGVPMIETTFTGANLNAMASAVLEEFRSRNVDLFDDAQLVADLGRLRIVERSFGYRLEATRNADGHADRATAFALSLLGARGNRSSPPPRVEGEIVAWPRAG